jgi:hypothetical protein
MAMYEGQIGIGNFVDYVVAIDTVTGVTTIKTFVATTYSAYAQAAAIDPTNEIFFWPYPFTSTPKDKTDLFVVAYTGGENVLGSSNYAEPLIINNMIRNIEFDQPRSKLYGITEDRDGNGFFVNINAEAGEVIILNPLPAGFHAGLSLKASAYDPQQGRYFFIFFVPPDGAEGTQLGIYNTLDNSLTTQQISCGSIANLEYDTIHNILYAIQQNSNGYSIHVVDPNTGTCTLFLEPQRNTILQDVSLSSFEQEMAFVDSVGIYILNMVTRVSRYLKPKPDIHTAIELVRYLA